MSESNGTGETGKNATGRDRAHTSRESRSSCFRAPLRHFATNRHVVNDKPSGLSKDLE